MSWLWLFFGFLLVDDGGISVVFLFLVLFFFMIFVKYVILFVWCFELNCLVVIGFIWIVKEGLRNGWRCLGVEVDGMVKEEVEIIVNCGRMLIWGGLDWGVLMIVVLIVVVLEWNFF